jgi:hypothetical protein
MNLHSLQIRRKAWVWVNATGGNGRTLGTHLWEITEPEAPEHRTRPGGYRPNMMWTNPRFSWNPVTVALSLMANRRWTPPLCNKQSTSRIPRLYAAVEGNFWHPICGDCELEAEDRGITPQYAIQFAQSSPTFTRIRREQELWSLLRYPSPIPTVQEMEELLPGQ